jgi:hypothetical protein
MDNLQQSVNSRFYDCYYGFLSAACTSKRLPNQTKLTDCRFVRSYRFGEEAAQ